MAQIVGGIGIYFVGVAIEKKLRFKPYVIETQELTSGDIPDVKWFDSESPKLDFDYGVVQESHDETMADETMADETMTDEPKTLRELYKLIFDIDCPTEQ